MACLLLPACAHSPQITAFVGPRWSEGEREFALTLMILQPFGEHGVTGCAHNSVIDKGEPFNNRPEITGDHCGAGGQWGGEKRDPR